MCRQCRKPENQPSLFLPTGPRCLSRNQRVTRSVFNFITPPSSLCFCLPVASWWLSLLPVQAFLTQLVCHLLDEGNSCYRDGDWQQATQQYSEGINVARYAQAEALVIPHELLECLYVNRAAAFYQAVRGVRSTWGDVAIIIFALRPISETLKLMENPG